MIRAITIRQPWARCIAVGRKDVENRGRNTNLRGEIAIHAAWATSREGNLDSRVIQLFGEEASLGVPTGAIIAVAELVDCHPAIQPAGLLDPTCCQPWGERRYNDGPAFHLVLANVRALDCPVPCRGSLLIGWTVPAEVEKQIRAQLVGVRS
jgi:hypothetical protein